MGMARTTNILLAVIAAALVALVVILGARGGCTERRSLQHAARGQVEATIRQFESEGWTLVERGGEQPDGGRYLIFTRCE